MSIRSALIMCAISFAGVGTAAAGGGGGSSHGGGFVCTNGVGVGCIGSIAILPINVNIKNIGVLDDNQLSVLSGDLDNLALLNGDILDYNTLLNNISTGLLSNILTQFGINLSGNDVQVCTELLFGIKLCNK